MSMRRVSAVPQQGRRISRLDEVLTAGLKREFRDNATISAASSEEPAWLREAARLLPRSDGEPAWFEEMKQDIENKNDAFNAAVDERLQCEEELEAMKKLYIEATDNAEQEISALLIKELRLLMNGIENNMVNTALVNAIQRFVVLVRGGTEMQKVVAAKTLWAFSASSVSNKRAIAAAGGIPPLVALANNGTEKQKNAAKSALWALAAGNDSNKRAIAAAGGGEYW